jgi:ABC-type uncharacterized transport system substrate-binding protein
MFTMRTPIMALTTRPPVTESSSLSPATFSNRDCAEIGGLMSYGANIPHGWRQAGVYVGLILRGAKPAELPEKAIQRVRREFWTTLERRCRGLN